MTQVNFIELMHKKLEKWDSEELSNFTKASGVYNGMDYNIAGNKLMDNTFIKGRFESALVALKQRPGVIDFTCEDVTVTFNTKNVSMETIYATINSILEIYAEEFKANKK